MNVRDFVLKEKKDAGTGVWVGVEVGDEELREFLKQVLSERPYVSWNKKATLGNQYLGRERQGEFVYFNLGDQAGLFGNTAVLAAAAGGVQEGNYCCLESSDDDASVWISIDGVEVIMRRLIRQEDHLHCIFYVAGSSSQ